MNYHDLMDLPMERFWSMWAMITVIEAQETLKNFALSDWPNQKKEQRQKIHKDMYRKAYPREFEKPKELSDAQIERILRG